MKSLNSSIESGQLLPGFYSQYKIRFSTFAFNERAYKSYLKCGFKEEGRLRQRIFRNGKYHDEILMGLLREEY